MGTSPGKIGTTVAWSAGYTGAGTRIAIIDTGTDTEHQSFNEAAYQYSLAYQAGLSKLSLEEYVESLDLLDVEEIAAVADQLNITVDPESAYINSKIPFGYNYVDADYDVRHINDSMGEHGSHVSGIAAANAYLLQEDGSFVPALQEVLVQGVAPDAQIITMKVFGKNGGAYTSDYMAAIEDAIVLGADSINLSLGSAKYGNTRSDSQVYQAIMDRLEDCGAVLCTSAGNNYSLGDLTYTDSLYMGDIHGYSMGSPGSYTNSLAVASVDNAGYTGRFFEIAGTLYEYREVLSNASQKPLSSLHGQRDYIAFPGTVTVEELQEMGELLSGKVVFHELGLTASDPYLVKQMEALDDCGALASIYSFAYGDLALNLSRYYTRSMPYICLANATRDAIIADSTPVTDENGEVLYYTGTIYVSASIDTYYADSEYYTMSDFSSWGVPGSLELKPEITAPGGSIYSVYGETRRSGGPDQYVQMSGTSMASPQVAGMAALAAQYIREKGLEEQTGLTARQLVQSLLMSTAVPMLEEASGYYYPVLRQGAGLANIGEVTAADSYILMDENATASYADGKIKAELFDDPDRTGEYSFSFYINNLEDGEKVFQLSAAIFTQGMFEDYTSYYENATTMYMSDSCAPLMADVTWTVDGEVIEPSGAVAGMDFNGDGKVSTADGQQLLDYVVGVTEEIQNLDKADLDADGDVDSHDAWQFFLELTTGTAVVAPNGSVKVDVSIALTEEQKAVLNANYPNGAYVEGYVFAESLVGAMELVGTSHSIPVLGFYGNWSDAPVYDAQSVNLESNFDNPTSRFPYNMNPNSTAYGITYASDSDTTYKFGGNPVVADEVYLPERNAINTENGSRITQVTYSMIRNVLDARYTVTNLTTGAVTTETDLGALYSMYYSNGVYYNDVSGQYVKTYIEGKEGDLIEMKVTFAMEYYVDAEGNVDWDALGAGSCYAITATIDNTAPELGQVAYDLMHGELVVTASDNRYVAGVALYDAAGLDLLTATGSKAEIQPGETAEYVLDMNGLNGESFLLQVVDYAGNAVTYTVEVSVGEISNDTPGMIVFNTSSTASSFGWNSMTITVNSSGRYSAKQAAYQAPDATYTAGTAVDNKMFLVDAAGNLYVSDWASFQSKTALGNLGRTVSDLAYNKVDGKIYGVSNNKLISIDKLSGVCTEVGTIGVSTYSLACDPEGNFYCVQYSGTGVYSFTLDTLAAPTKIGKLSYTSYETQAMEYDPNTGNLVYFGCDTYSFWGMTFEDPYCTLIDPATGAVVANMYGSYPNSTLLIRDDTGAADDSWAAPTDEVMGVALTASETVYKNVGKKLSAVVYPWTVSDTSLIWGTSDPSVAIVDANGVVTGVAAGTAVITAISVFDPTAKASCTVTVKEAGVTVKGVLEDEKGVTQTFTYDLDKEATWTGGMTMDTTLLSADRDPKTGNYFVVDSIYSNYGLTKYSADGAVLARVDSAVGAPLWDLAYCPVYSEIEGKDLVAAAYSSYLLTPQDALDMSGLGFDMKSVAGESFVVAVAAAGHGEYEGRDCEHIYMLGSSGSVYDFLIYEDGGWGAYYESYASDLPVDFEVDYDFYGNYWQYGYSLCVGDDGNLYFAHNNGMSTDLYRLTFNAETQAYETVCIANLGETVYPVALTEVSVNGAVAVNSASQTLSDGETVSAVSISEAEAQRAAAEAALDRSDEWLDVNSAAEVDKEENTVTLTVTAKDAENNEVDSTNGVMTVNYDAS
ncbi:MAG: S8 family serine peptidase, partial [Oscillospiraceae bacterium]|nr:S8 family serine peptidase [Oscillospiraceae bacterium]